MADQTTLLSIHVGRFFPMYTSDGGSNYCNNLKRMGEENREDGIRACDFNIYHPFDGFAKHVYGQPEFMDCFLKASVARGDLPGGWFSDGVPLHLTCINSNLIKNSLQQKYTDTLFLVRKQKGSKGYIHFETSTVLAWDNLLKAHHYKDAILEFDYNAREENSMELPLVLQIFLYTGPACKKSEEMMRLVHPSPQLTNSLDQGLCYIPLHRHSNKTLLKSSLTGPAEVLMKHAPKRDLLRFLKSQPEFAARLGTMDYAIAAGYLAGAMEPDEKKRKELLGILFKLRPELIGEIMSGLNPAVKIIRQEGKQEGRQEGYKEVAQRMHERGLANSLIADVIGWNTQKVQELFA